MKVANMHVLRLDFHFSGLYGIYYITATSSKGYLYSQCRVTTADKQVAILYALRFPYVPSSDLCIVVMI